MQLSRKSSRRDVLEKKISGLDAELGLSERYKPDRDVGGLADAIFDEIMDYEDDLEQVDDDGLSVLNHMDSIFGGFDRELDLDFGQTEVSKDVPLANRGQMDRIFDYRISDTNVEEQSDEVYDFQPRGILQGLGTDFGMPATEKATRSRTGGSGLQGLMSGLISRESSSSSFENDLFYIGDSHRDPVIRLANQTKPSPKPSPPSIKPKTVPPPRR
jgi:hypothetical protein